MRLLFLIVGIMVLGTGSVRAATNEPGTEVIVLYNSRLPESKALAEYYAAKRAIPASQVWGFETSANEEISRADYSRSIQTPLLIKLTQSKLWQFGSGTLSGPNGESVRVENKLIRSEIRYAVLCYGMPLRISADATITGGKEEAMRPELRRNEAAVDSELAALPMIKMDLPLAGPLRNAGYLATNVADLHPTNGVLMVARLDGPSTAIARGLVDKALQAEKDGLWGRAYFDLRDATDPGMKVGEEFIRTAAGVCQALGFETVVDTNAATFGANYPMSQIGFYSGWYDSIVSGPFTLPEVEFMPGAFAYHLHSLSAVTVRHPGVNWVGPLLAKGVTITMGCTYEPYLGATPNIGIFAARLIGQGFTFGEAAYASQNVLSWQTAVIGDPLYRPFGRAPQQIHQQLAQTRSPLLEWAQLRLVNLGLAKGMSVFQAMQYLEQIPLTKTSALLNEKMGDLCVEGGKPSSALHFYEQALKLEPTRQQRVRLRLVLGERLSEASRDADAYDNYEKLLTEWPDYPGNKEVAAKLLALAQKLNRKDGVEKWTALIKALTPPPPAPATNATAKPAPPAKPAAPPQPPPVKPVGLPPSPFKR